MQRLQGVGGVELGNVVAFNVDVGTGEELLLLHTVADDHDIVERVGFLLQRDPEIVDGDLDVLLNISDIRYIERLTILSTDGEVTIEVGDRRRLCTLHPDRGSDERFTIRCRNHCALHDLRVKSRGLTKPYRWEEQ